MKAETRYSLVSINVPLGLPRPPHFVFGEIGARCKGSSVNAKKHSVFGVQGHVVVVYKSARLY